MPESPRLVYHPPANISAKHHSWKVVLDLRQIHTLDCSCKRPHAVLVTRHTCSIFARARPRLHLSHMEPLPCSAPIWLYSYSSEPQGRAEQYICCLENKATNPQCHQWKAEHSSTLLKGEWWESSSFTLCQNSTGALHCHHSNPRTGNISFMQS